MSNQQFKKKLFFFFAKQKINQEKSKQREKKLKERKKTRKNSTTIRIQTEIPPSISFERNDVERFEMWLYYRIETQTKERGFEK